MMVEIGSFAVSESIGAGGMGVVYRGVHRSSGLPVAVKLLPPSFRSRSLRREVQALGVLHHPAIVRVLDAGELDATTATALGVPAESTWITMELVEGGTVKQHRPESWSTARRIVVGVLRGLAHAHARGVIHRDIKPSNLLLDGDGQVRIADFGLASLAGGGRRTSGGSPGYASPSSEPIGPWSDLFAVGAVAAWMTTGRPELAPSTGELDGLSESAVAWIERMRGPLADRPRSAIEALRALPGASEVPRLASSLGGGPALPGVGAGLLEVRSLPVQGRHDEQAWLQSALERVIASGEPQVRLIEGLPGIGKSRLARWLSASAHEWHGLTTLTATHSEEAMALDGLAGLVGRALGVLGMPATQALQRAAAELDRLGLEEDVQEDLLDVLLPAVTAARRAQPPSRALQWGATRSLVDAHLRHGPVVLWLDDVQWGEDSLQWLSWLLALPRARALVVVCTARVAGSPAMDDLSVPVERRTLAPLADGGASLTRSLLGVSEELATQVAEIAEGVPLFAVELLRHWQRTGQGTPTLPPSLHALWLTQIQALGPFAVDLERLAALGPSADRDEFAGLCEDPDAAVACFVEQGLVELREGRLALTHGLLADSLEQESRAQGRWSAHHAACLQLLACRYGAKDASTAGRRAAHHRARGDDRAELDTLLDALRFEVERGASAQGEAWRLRLQDLLDRLHPVDRGPSRERAIHLDLSAEFAFNRGEGAAALALAHQALREVRALDDPTMIGHALWREASYKRSVRGSDASALLDAAEAAHRAVPSVLGLSRVAVVRAEIERDLGRVTHALSLYQAIIDDPILSPARRAVSLGSMGEIWRNLGDRERARDLMAQARALMLEHGLTERLAMSENVLGDLARDEGDHATAAEHYERCLRIASRLGLEQARAAVFGRLNLAVTRNHLGDGAAALGELAEVEARLRELGLAVLLVAIHANQVWAHALLGDPDGVRHALTAYRRQMVLTPMYDPDNAAALEASLEHLAAPLRQEVASAVHDQRVGVDSRRPGSGRQM